MSQTDIQKYTKVFIEVDKDRDGKITGEEARNLFLSWRLPREVLKQEGRPFQLYFKVLRSDDTLMQATTQPSISYVDSTNWRPSSGLSQQGIPAPRPPVPVSGVRPLIQSSVPSRMGGAVWASQQRAMPHLPKNKMDQQNEHGGFSELTSGDKKAHEQGSKIMDSKEKIEYYRSKMQELVLYKSRCDNKLNEITERASADKHEVESLAKKYEEKYKQVAEVASKLTVEDATLRDIQVRKSELQNAIVNMEKGGSADGLLQSELEELVKALHDRSKHHGLNIKSTATIDLPIGWQPGIAEGAVDWDEDWDKFEDEGFSIVKDLSAEKGYDSNRSNSQSQVVGTDNSFADGASPAVSPTHTYSTVDMLSNAGQYNFMKETTYDHSEYGSVRSPPASPGRSVFGSPSQDSHSVGTGVHGTSPRARHNDSDQGGDESIFSENKFTDEPSWGAALDTNDDVDSVWGFGAKDIGHEKSSSNSFFEAGDFGLGSSHIDSPSATSVMGKDKNSPFFDSVPSTPTSSRVHRRNWAKCRRTMVLTASADSIPSRRRTADILHMAKGPSKGSIPFAAATISAMVGDQAGVNVVGVVDMRVLLHYERVAALVAYGVQRLPSPTTYISSQGRRPEMLCRSRKAASASATAGATLSRRALTRTRTTTHIATYHDAVSTAEVAAEERWCRRGVAMVGDLFCLKTTTLE
ncbi:hypothetical protein HPP92_020703 [Vanilla planifolia]|uniref:EF-hand domain-containing protein n=1 Tax=Vanilla planifolia TaxID=51239 RepID=A0A835UIA4_VANPL|nr:hypothetical protein HPP92_020703 [Vanilla planifolia]